MKTYLLNCFLLVLPALAWNIFLTSRLPQRWFAPQVFDDVPGWLLGLENILRLLVFFLPLLMPPKRGYNLGRRDRSADGFSQIS